MRCKICGAKLKKEGDICRNCYHEYKEKEKLETIQEEELLRVNRKYSPKFNLLKNGDIIIDYCCIGWIERIYYVYWYFNNGIVCDNFWFVDVL